MIALAKDSYTPDPTPALARLLSDSALSRAALGACGFPIALLDAGSGSRPFAYVNPAFERYFGYRESEALGRSPATLLLHGDEPLLHRLLAESTSSRWQLRTWGKDGGARYVELALSAIRSSEGRISHWVLAFTDRSEVERMRAELEALKAKSETA